jgi:prepilin peptidase CpaA
MIEHYTPQIQLVALVGALGLLAYAAVSDARSFIIPNWVSVALVALFLVYAAPVFASISWQDHVLASLAVLAGGFVLFALNLLGAGDAKLLAALALWLGFNKMPELLLYTVFGGGVLAGLLIAVTLIKQYVLNQPGLTVRKAKLPYGIAIAGAGYVLLLGSIKQLGIV